MPSFLQRAARYAAILFLVATVVHPRLVLAQHAIDDDFVRWATAHAIPTGSVEMADPLDDLRMLSSIVGSARVVALGEPTHGMHEPLAFRNRLFRYLVEEMGFSAIALESALPESRRLAELVAGGPGAPPIADAPAIVRQSFTWGFGNFGENLELVRWMRAYNDEPAHRRKIRLYGIDLSLGGPLGSSPTTASLDGALSYLAHVDSSAARRARGRFAPYVSRLPGDASSGFTRAELDGLSAAIDSLAAQLEERRATYIAASTEAEYAWAQRDAEVARQGVQMLRVQVAPQPRGGIPPAAWRVIAARDSAMAENVRWALAREGPTGRLLVFAHDVHVKNAPTVGGIWSVLERPPTVMGQYLRRALGAQLLIIGTSDGSPPDGNSDATSVDAALARVAVPRFIIDLRAADRDTAASAWLATQRKLRANGGTFVTLAPGQAFDLLWYAGPLTPAHRNAP